MGRSRDEFAAFVSADATRLLRIAYLLTGDPTAAEDLLQDVLERTYVHWPRIDNPFGYTRTALARHAANRWRTRARRPQIALLDGDHPWQPDESSRTDDRDQLIRALATLPIRQRAAVVLRYLEEMSEAEAAEVLRCSVGTVKSQTSRGLARLRLVLDVDSPPSRPAPTERRSRPGSPPTAGSPPSANQQFPVNPQSPANGSTR